MTYIKYIFPFLFLVTYPFSAKAAFVLKEIPKLPFINQKAAYIQYPDGDTTAYYRFFDKLDSLVYLKQGNVNILQIGGSHIQAGMMSNQMKRNLASAFPYANRDMVFPFSAAKTNNPANYSTTYTGEWNIARNVLRAPQYPLGLTGMCIGTTDSTASITIKLRGDSIVPFSQVYVLANQNAALEPYLGIKDSVYTSTYDSLKQAFCFYFAAPVDSFTLTFSAKPGGAYRDFELRGFWLDNDVSGISYIDIGVNGASVPSYLKCSLLEQDLALVKPDLCILSIGINDASGSHFDTAYFKNNYRELIRRIHNVAPDCIILFTTNNDSYRRVKRRYYNNRNGLLAQKAFYSLANEYNTGVWDLFTFMGGLTSITKWEQQGLARRDRIHFSRQGYELIGDAMYNALMQDYINYLNSKLQFTHVE